jgi:hypothetical protein
MRGDYPCPSRVENNDSIPPQEPAFSFNIGFLAKHSSIVYSNAALMPEPAPLEGILNLSPFGDHSSS